MSNIAHNWSHFLSEPSSAEYLYIQGKYVMLTLADNFGKKGMRCSKFFVSQHFRSTFRLQSERKGDERWLFLPWCCPLIRSKLFLLHMLSALDPIWVSEFSLSSVQGSNWGSYWLAIIALLIRSLVKSLTWLRPVWVMRLHKSTQKIKSLCFLSVSSGYHFSCINGQAR